MFGKCRRPTGRDGAHVLDGNGFAAADIDGEFSHAFVFVVLEHDALTGATGEPEAVHTGFDVELEHLAVGLLVEAPIGVHRRDGGRKNPFELVHSHCPCLGLDCLHGCVIWL